MSKISHYQVSTISLLGFTGLILLAGLYSELFRPRIVKETKKTQLLANPIRKDILANIKEITLSNFNNSFTLKKIEQKWSLVSPVKMKASYSNLERIINSLQGIDVKTLFKKDKVNIQNFSLKKPIMSLLIKSELNETQKIDFGMINTIDQSSYLLVDNINAIFQTNIVSSELIKLKLSDFINNNIFPKDIDSVAKFETINTRSNTPIQILENKDNTWISNKYRTISNDSVRRKIKRILGIGAKVIVDATDEKTENFLSNYLKNPKMKVRIKLKNEQFSRNYLVSYLVNKNDALKINKRSSFIIKDLTDNIIYLVDKSSFNQFNIRYSDLK